MNMDTFEFKGCIEIKELLGKKADDELKLLELIEEVPTDSIYYHMYSYFLRHSYVTEPYPNDFANWAALQVRDRVLGEQLASVTSGRFKSLEDIRLELVDIIDQHLSTIHTIPFIGYGQPFYFMKSQIIEIPTGVRVTTFKEFTEALKTVEVSAIYNHVFEARLRIRKGKSDFSLWLEETQGKQELAGKIELIDSYMYSLEGLRNKIVELCEKEPEQ